MNLLVAALKAPMNLLVAALKTTLQSATVVFIIERRAVSVPEQSLESFNPWWREEYDMGGDPSIMAWTKSMVRREVGKEHSFRDGDLIYSLRGPRRVGKTTLLKLEVKRLLTSVPRWNVMYYSFDMGGTPADIVRVINEYSDRVGKAAKGRRFVFLDEVSSVRDWQGGIKRLKDMGRLVDCTVIVAGSHSTDEGRGAETLQGRRGTATGDDPLDKVLRPLSFGEFVRARDEELARRLADLGLVDGGGRAMLAREVAAGCVGPSLTDLSAYREDLDAHLAAYLVTGGMPAVADEFQRTMRIEEATYATYLLDAGRDIAWSGRDVSKVTRLVPNILRSTGERVSWSSLRRGTGIASPRTVEGCVGALADTFAMRVLYRYDHATGMPCFGGQKKLYLQDPFIFHAYNGMRSAGGHFDMCVEHLADPEKKAALVEQVAADHAVRLAFALSPSKAGFRSAYSVFHWVGGGLAKREVDLVVRDSGSLVPIEVRYSDAVSRSDLYGLSDFRKATGTKGGVLVTRDKLGERSGFAMVPASLFLLLG